MMPVGTVLSEREMHALLVTNYDRVLAWTIRHIGSKIVAEDVMSAACIKAIKARGSYREGGDFQAWFFRIVKNEYIDLFRRQQRQRTDNMSERQLELLRGFAPDSLSTTSYHEMLRIITTQLHWAYRDVLLSICVEGLDYAETAKRYGTTCGTIKSRLSRGKAKMRELLGEES